MAEIVLPTEVEVTQAPSMVSPISRRRRLFALGVVLSVSLLHFVFASFYYLLGGTVPLDAHQRAFRLVGALVAESTSLLVLWYVLSERESGWRAIGWTPAWKDLPEGFGLLIVGYLATIPPVLVFQAAYRSYAGHHLHAKSLESVLGFGISLFSIAFVLLNPFFEELIVRAYTMSEVMDLGGTRLLAIVVSVSLQMSYHFYQGVLRSMAIAATFTVFSIYFARTRRIAPIILAHLCFEPRARQGNFLVLCFQHLMCENSAGFPEGKNAEAFSCRFALPVRDHPIGRGTSQEAGCEEGFCWPRSR